MQRVATPGPPPPDTFAPAAHTGRLRAAWTSTAESATTTSELATFLNGRLDELEGQALLDEASLAAVIDEAADRLHDAGLDDVASEAVRQLLRSVYDFLLATNSDQPVTTTPPPAAAPASPPSATRPPAAVAAPAPLERSPELDAVERLVGRGLFDQAASALTTLATRADTPPLVAVALDAGDRSKAAGEARAASECYTAAWTADRLDERPLWRLASLAVEAGDRELAVSYLRRIVALLQWRGDVRGVMRVYRKMSILVPGAWQMAVPALPSWPHADSN